MENFTSFLDSFRQSALFKYDSGLHHTRFLILFLSFIFSIGQLNAQWVQVGQDINGNYPGDRLGFNLDITPDGNRFIVSAPAFGSQTIPQSKRGYALIFEYNTSAWVQVGDTLWGDYEDDHFGINVSISHSGNRIAVGSGFKTDEEGFRTAGQVRTYDYNPDNSIWEQVGQDLNGDAPVDYYGNTVSLDATGMRLAIGADGNDNIGINSGLVRIFDYNPDEKRWGQVGQDMEGDAAYDQFGGIVLLSPDGSRLVSNAPYYDGGNGENSGYAQIFDYYHDSLKWIQVGQKIEGEAEGDESTNFGGNGINISSDGTRIAIGAKKNDGNGTYSGHVRIFDYNMDSLKWIQVGQDIDGEAAFNYFGQCVSLSDDGNRLAVSAPRNSANGSFTGHVRMFEYNAELLSWEQLGGDLDGDESGDEFGHVLLLSSDGTRLFVGTSIDDNGGKVRVYDYLGCASNVMLISDDFEGGFGNWNDGGNDCDRVAGNANSGNYSIRLRDDSGVNSSIYSNDLDMEGVSFATIRFSYYALSMESGKDFFLEVSTDGGSSYDIYKTWVSGENFRNSTRINESISVSIPFSATTRFRIRCDGQTNNDRVYFDDIIIIACSVKGCPVVGEPCEDGDPCTVGETFTEDCNCTGGLYVDNDNDGYCVGEDPDDNDACNPDPGSPLCDNPADTMVVDVISMYRRFAGPNWNAVARVIILDEFGIGVNGASVAVSWEGPKSGSSSGFSDGQGIVSFNSPKTRAGGCFDITVDTVTKDGWTWDNTNSELTDQICNPPQASSMAREDYQDHQPGMHMKIYPNPFSDRMDIQFEVEEAGFVLLEIYNVNGQKIRTLRSAFLQPGLYNDHWDRLNSGTSTVLNGLYIVRLQMAEQVENQRVCLLR